LKPSAAEESYAWDARDGEIGKHADVVAGNEDLPDFLVQADSADFKYASAPWVSPTGP